MYSKCRNFVMIPLQPNRKEENKKKKDSLNECLKTTATTPKKNEGPPLNIKVKNQNKDNHNDVPQYSGMSKTITITETDGELVLSKMMTKALDQKSAFNINSLYAVLNNSITFSPNEREMLKDESVIYACSTLINSTACTQHCTRTNGPDASNSEQRERASYDFEKLKALYRPITIPKSPTLKCLKEQKLNINTLKLILKNYTDDDPVFIRPEARNILLTSATLGITRNDPDICHLCCGDIIHSLYI